MPQNVLHSHLCTSCASNFRRSENFRNTGNWWDPYGGSKPWSCLNQAKQWHIHARQSTDLRVKTAFKSCGARMIKKWNLGALAHSCRSLSRSYPGFCSMKRLEVFLLPLDRMLIHRRSLPRNLSGFLNNLAITFIQLGRERQCESEVSCPRTQHNVPGQGSNPDRPLWSQAR